MRYCKNDVINLQACEVCNGFVGRRFDANYILLRIYNRYLILEAKLVYILYYRFTICAIIALYKRDLNYRWQRV